MNAVANCLREGSGSLEILEVPLLLSEAQFRALELAAHSMGLSAAEMVRTLLRDFLRNQAGTN
ncbi:MAG: hypothetical protein ACKO23_13480 [Gemmataceae bacterium]